MTGLSRTPDPETLSELPRDAEQRRAAIQELLDAEPVALPSDPGELRRELDSAHDPAG